MGPSGQCEKAPMGLASSDDVLANRIAHVARPPRGRRARRDEPARRLWRDRRPIAFTGGGDAAPDADPRHPSDRSRGRRRGLHPPQPCRARARRHERVDRQGAAQHVQRHLRRLATLAARVLVGHDTRQGPALPRRRRAHQRHRLPSPSRARTSSSTGAPSRRAPRRPSRTPASSRRPPSWPSPSTPSSGPCRSAPRAASAR